MKILYCYIENFGKLSDKKFDFVDGCNILCEENGWGKSTLSSFIKVMFFGFENEKTRDDFKNERKRYKPWQGGVYGGQMEFEVAGKTYIVQRVFGAKEKDDEFSLRDKSTNLPTNDYSSSIGEELFKIDGESFGRTVFISQNACETSTTDQINAKIGNLAENTDDINNYEKVNKTLTDLLNAMSPTRKTGTLFKKKEEINELTTKVKNTSAIDQAIQEFINKKKQQRQEYEELDIQKKDLQQKQKQVSIYKDLFAKKEKYGELWDAFQERKGRRDRARGYFPGELPKDKELREQISDSIELSKEQQLVTVYELTQEESSKLQELEKCFFSDTPTKEKMEEVVTKIQELQEIRVDMAKNQLSKEELDQFHEYQQQFQEGALDSEKVDELISNWNLRSEKKNVLNTKKASLSTLQSLSNQKEKKEGSPILLIGIILIVLGLAIMSLQITVGALSLVGGVVLTIVAVVSKSKKKKQTVTPEKDPFVSLQQEIGEDEWFILKIQKEVQDFFAVYNMNYQEEKVLNELYQLKENGRQYESLIGKKRVFQEKNLEEKSEKYEKEIQSFLIRYFSEEDFQEKRYLQCMNQLKEKIRILKELKEKKIRFVQVKDNCDKRMERIENYIKDLSLPLQDNVQEELLEMERHLQEYHTCAAEFEKAKKEKELFEEREDVEKIMKVETIEKVESMEVLDQEWNNILARVERIQENILAYDRQLGELQEERDNLTEEEDRLGILREEYEKDKKKYDLLGQTKKLLEQGKNSFTARYMGPIMSSYKKYYQILTQGEATHYHIDANANLTVDELGMERETQFLSTGFRDLIGICMRMALVDAMYSEEKPFVIFDDPFVNLDQEKTQGGLELLQSIAKEYQVIYFTCHESRKF